MWRTVATIGLVSALITMTSGCATTQVGQPTPETTTNQGAEGLNQSQSPEQQFLAARKIILAKGYDPGLDATAWHTNYQLNALAAVINPTADGHPDWVFFFVNGRYIGTDTSTPSLGLQITDSTSDTATVRYALYRDNDPLCCPHSLASVTYKWDGTKIVPLNPRPPATGGGDNGHR